MFDKLKNKYRNFAEKIKEVPQQSQILQKGILTPQEFIQAGDKLILISPIWQWNQCQTQYESVGLPQQKNYLSAQIHSRKRFNNNQKNCLEIQNENGFKIISQKTENDQNQKKVITLDSSSDENSENSVEEETQILLRIYQVYITYDYYYNTARFWITGVDYQNNPLTKNQIYEDICEEYIDKTITEQENPYIVEN